MYHDAPGKKKTDFRAAAAAVARASTVHTARVKGGPAAPLLAPGAARHGPGSSAAPAVDLRRAASVESRGVSPPPSLSSSLWPAHHQEVRSRGNGTVNGPAGPREEDECGVGGAVVTAAEESATGRGRRLEGTWRSGGP